MNDKPVAWTDGNGHYFDKNSFFPVDDLIPLYTHPAKTLTDEEIVSVWDENCIVLDTDRTIIEFARAILRKSQEK